MDYESHFLHIFFIFFVLPTSNRIKYNNPIQLGLKKRIYSKMNTWIPFKYEQMVKAMIDLGVCSS